jgi:FlaA1/EpsC-like NDP-sugar epimerase
MINRILIVGFGKAGKSLAKSIDKTNDKVIGFLDDSIIDSKVLGKLSDVNVTIKTNKINSVFIAIPTIPAKKIREFINSIENQDVKISIIPRTFNIISKNTVNINDLSDIDILHLIGREPIKHDLIACKDLIKDKTIIVTGAAGSIGSKLVKLLVDLNPKLIVCVDWWENGIFYLQQDLQSKNNIEYRIADIKNPHTVDQIFKKYKPDILFHAAAYKHVPLMQDNPIEAFNNNVWGSYNLMSLSIQNNIKNFVYISTDKAVNPVNVMGTTKRLGEMILEVLANSQDITKFNAVRFGNVIQSNGSVMHIFKKQIEQGQPLTVTDKNVTRYFMTIEEAAQLVIQSTVLGKNGEIFVLDMGEPIKVIDLAKSLVRILNKQIKIKITGLRPGEKMFEELSYDTNHVDLTPNKKVFIVKNEKEFDYDKFIKMIDKLIDRTLSYEISSQDLITKLIDLGFKIKK